MSTDPAPSRRGSGSVSARRCGERRSRVQRPLGPPHLRRRAPRASQGNAQPRRDLCSDRHEVRLSPQRRWYVRTAAAHSTRGWIRHAGVLRLHPIRTIVSARPSRGLPRRGRDRFSHSERGATRDSPRASKPTPSRSRSRRPGARTLRVANLLVSGNGVRHVSPPRGVLVPRRAPRSRHGEGKRGPVSPFRSSRLLSTYAHT